MEQSVQEKAELQREFDLIMEEKEALKRLLEKQRQEAVSMKVREALSAQRRALFSMCSSGSSAESSGLTVIVCSCRMSLKTKTKKTSN